MRNISKILLLSLVGSFLSAADAYDINLVLISARQKDGVIVAAAASAKPSGLAHLKRENSDLKARVDALQEENTRLLEALRAVAIPPDPFHHLQGSDTLEVIKCITDPSHVEHYLKKVKETKIWLVKRFVDALQPTNGPFIDSHVRISDHTRDAFKNTLERLINSVEFRLRSEHDVPLSSDESAYVLASSFETGVEPLSLPHDATLFSLLTFASKVQVAIANVVDRWVVGLLLDENSTFLAGEVAISGHLADRNRDTFKTAIKHAMFG